MRRAVTIAFAIVAIAGCSSRSIRTLNRVSFATSSALIMCDWSQTSKAADRGWMRQINGETWSQYDSNPILGRTPTSEHVAMYMGGVLIVNYLAYVLTPERYRSIAPLAITGVQVDSVVHNVRNGTGLCGL